MRAEKRDILTTCTPQDTPRFEQLLEDGLRCGMKLRYAVQPSPNRLAHAFIIGAKFFDSALNASMLGDGIPLK